MSEAQKNFWAQRYPEGVIQSLEEREIPLSAFLARGINQGNYDANRGIPGTGIIISPYFTQTVEGEEVPVYGTLTYAQTYDSGTIHSFSTLYVKEEALPLTVTLRLQEWQAEKVVLLPERMQTRAVLKGDEVTFSPKGFGDYTLLFNDDDQYHGYTLLVRPYVDEDEEIRSLQQQYGAEHVTVFEPGLHQIKYHCVTEDNSVVYIRSGALLLAEHCWDIRCEEDNSKAEEPETLSGCTGSRSPFFAVSHRRNIRIYGQGALDLSQLDWHERRGMMFSDSRELYIRGIQLINFPEWALIFYQCRQVDIRYVTVFGYKTNSDGFAICNCQDALIADCFARSGDDLFEVKTLHSQTNAACRNVTFIRCTAWNGKARCFGVTGEVWHEISDITFKDCDIICRDATWDNDRIGGLVLIVEEGGAPIRNIVFDSVSIHRDYGRPINLTLYNQDLPEVFFENILFRNVHVFGDLPPQILVGKYQKSPITLAFEHSTVNGRPVTAASIAVWDGNSTCLQIYAK